MTEKIAKITLETADGGIFRRCWNEGWEVGDKPVSEDLLPGRRMYDLLRQAEERGYSVTQHDADNATLLRGEITRIDFQQESLGIQVSTYPRGWTAKTRPCNQSTALNSMEEVLAPYLAEGSGWKVRRWLDGARAWKGQIQPVREKGTILRMRNQYSMQGAELTRLAGGYTSHIDFAFDL
jgi:hypothetical protein